jgi:cytochrome P450
LAKQPETQRRVREEILAARRDALRSTGTDEIPFSYYEKMPLLVAVTKVRRNLVTSVYEDGLTFWYKEGLRMHPVRFTGPRQAVEDEVIPLSQPLNLPDGRSITEIPVSKGQNIWLNIPGYNRLPSIFGENAHEFDVDRWLDGRLDALPGMVGVYGNLATFGHGTHACIGEPLPFDSYAKCVFTFRRVEIQCSQDTDHSHRAVGEL